MAAGYLKPIVLVYQEFERVSPALGNPDLAACIIGPAYYVLTYNDDKSIILAGFSEYRVTNNIIVPRYNVIYPNSLTLEAFDETELLTPVYAITFQDVTDFTAQYGIIEGNTTQDPDTLVVTPGLNDLNLTLTYGLSGATNPTVEVSLADADMVEMVVGLHELTTSAALDVTGITTATIAVDSLDFENDYDVQVGDYLVLNVLNGGIQDVQQFEISVVSGVTLTILTPGGVFDPGGIAYTPGVGPGTDDDFFADNLGSTGSVIYIKRIGVTANKNTLVFQSTDSPLNTLLLKDPADINYSSATASSFAVADIFGGNAVIWDTTAYTLPAPTILLIPNPDNIPGLELVTASTEVVADNAVIVVAGGRGQVWGELTFVNPVDIVSGEFENLESLSLPSVESATNPTSTTFTVASSDINFFTDGNVYFVTDALDPLVRERFIVLSAVGNTVTTTAALTNYPYSAGSVISIPGYDTVVHDNINFELLGVLPGDLLYIEDENSNEKKTYNISNVNGFKLTTDGVFESEDQFMGITNLSSDPYYTYITELSATEAAGQTVLSVLTGQGFSVTTNKYYLITSSDGTISEEIFVDTNAANDITLLTALVNEFDAGSVISEATQFRRDYVGGKFTVYRGGLKALVITDAASNVLQDADEDSLISFSLGKPTAVSKGFLAPHIHIEPGDKVFISRPTADFNTEFVLHRVFDIAKDRLILTSPIEVDVAVRSTATRVAGTDETVLFYVQKEGQMDMVLPLDSYVEDDDLYTVTLNNASALIEPRFMTTGFAELNAAVGTYVTVDDQGNVNTDNTIKGRIVEGTIYVGSRSLRTDLSNQLITIFNTNEIEGIVGKIIPENPLALGMFIALQNSGGTFVRGYAIDDQGLTALAEQVAYGKAMDFLKGVTTVYSLVPLTRNNAILGAFMQHVTQLSSPEKGAWRILFINTELTTEKVIIDRLGATESLDTNITIKYVGLDQTNHKRFQDANATFVSDGVSAGMKLRLYYDNTSKSGDNRVYTVDQVNSQTIITMTEVIVDEIGDAYPSGDNTIGNMNYEIIRDLNKTEQAEVIALVSESYNNRRVFSIWPDIAIIGEDNLPGYYLGCVVAGLVSGLPAHQGFTRWGIGAINAVKNSKDYFNEDQLDMIAAGGTYIFVQDAPGALPYARHQLSTDRQFVETQELSITKNFDFMSYFFKGLLEPFIGTWNVTDDTINAIGRVLKAGIAFQESRRYPRIGAALEPGKTAIRSIARSDISSDRIEIYMDLGLPRPLNTIGLHLIV